MTLPKQKKVISRQISVPVLDNLKAIPVVKSIAKNVLVGNVKYRQLIIPAMRNKSRYKKGDFWLDI